MPSVSPRSFRDGGIGSREAEARHPVKEVPAHIYLFEIPGDPIGWDTFSIQETLRHFGSQIDFANRVYANAGIKFSLDNRHFPPMHSSRSLTLIHETDPATALGCYDAATSDLAVIHALVTDPDVADAVTIIAPRYEAPIATPGDCPVTCVNDKPDCAGTPVDHPKCGTAGYCVPAGSFSSGIGCFKDDHTCDRQECDPIGASGVSFVFNPPASAGQNASDGSGFKSNDYDAGNASQYTDLTLQAWAANVWLGYHDEVLIRSANDGFHFIEGQRVEPNQTFEFGSSAQQTRTEWAPLVDTIELAVGDFSGDYRADCLISAPSSAGAGAVGTKLWLGGEYSVQPGSFYRADLTPDITATAVADFVRAGHDDVMFTTTTGSYLYAGVAGGTFTNVWSGSYPSSSWVWFGRE